MITPPEHSSNHDEYLRRYLKTGVKNVMGKKRELAAVRKDGSQFPIELGLSEIKTVTGDKRFFSGFVKDLTRQKKDEGKLIRNNNIRMGIIEASFDALFAIDEHCTIQMVNQASCEQFGWSKFEFLGQNINMIVDPEHSLKHDGYIRRYLDTGHNKLIGRQSEVKAVRKDGTIFPVRLGLAKVAGLENSSPLFVAFIRDLTEEKKLIETENEKAAAEALLLNMLPEDVAIRLKKDPSHIADHFSNTTILFADIVGFTAMSSRLSPLEVVKMLNLLFSSFDFLVDRYGLNKVKTIGDCYMVTSVPTKNHQNDDCSRVCHFALDILQELFSYNRRHPGQDLNLRVGINTGSVVAGVVGTKRFLYDIWGDAVNLASRMESTGIPGKIQVTPDVVVHAGDIFVFESRGMVHVKGKGEMETFILKDRKKPRPAIVPCSHRRITMISPTLSAVDSLKFSAESGKWLSEKYPLCSSRSLIVEDDEDKDDNEDED